MLTDPAPTPTFSGLTRVASFSTAGTRALRAAGQLPFSAYLREHGWLCLGFTGILAAVTTPASMLLHRLGANCWQTALTLSTLVALIAMRSRYQVAVREFAVRHELQRSTAEAAGAAQLAAVGTLAAGVAHEIKNPLNAIRTGAMALRRCHTDPPAARELLEMIDECVERISQITGALIDHCRPEDGEELSLVDLRVGLESTLRLLSERLYSAQVEVVRDYRSPRPVQGRARQLNQVLLSLLDNALRASHAGGRIFVTLEERGEQQLLRVRDEGCGIPVERLPRLFQPFFTTRDVGEGVGLGLYLVHQIIEGHRGTLEVYSAEGAGSEFCVALPAARPLSLPTPPRGVPAERGNGDMLKKL